MKKTPHQRFVENLRKQYAKKVIPPVKTHQEPLFSLGDGNSASIDEKTIQQLFDKLFGALSGDE